MLFGLGYFHKKQFCHFSEIGKFSKNSTTVENFPIALTMTELSKYMQLFFDGNKITQILFMMSINYNLNKM